MEGAGFRYKGQLSPKSDRVTFLHSTTGAQVHFDAGTALAEGQKPHWHIQGQGGERYSMKGKRVESFDAAGHIRAA